MLRLAILFLMIALIAAYFGFDGMAGYSWVGAKILFLIFLVLAVSCLTWESLITKGEHIETNGRQSVE